MKKIIIAIMGLMVLAVSKPVECVTLVDEFGEPTHNRAVIVYGEGNNYGCAIRFDNKDTSIVGIIFHKFLGSSSEFKNIRVRDENGNTITIGGYYGYSGGTSVWYCENKEYVERLINLCKMNTNLKIAIDDYEDETYVYTFDCIGFLLSWDKFLAK